jgi:hypothetical protein
MATIPDKIVKGTVKFFVVLFVMTIINAIVWECFAFFLYDCTDAGLPGYFGPGQWVHNFDGHSVMAVPHVVHGRSMSEPDTIKEGWSVARLLYLWFAFFIVSLAVSFWLATKQWSSKQQAGEHTIIIS